MDRKVKVVLIRLLECRVMGGKALPIYLDKNQPLGIDSIKGYVDQRCGSNVEVRTIDLHDSVWMEPLKNLAIVSDPLNINTRPKPDQRIFDAIDKLFNLFNIKDCDIVGLSAPVSTEKMLYLLLWYLTVSKWFGSQIKITGNIISTFCFDQILEDYPDVLCSTGAGEEIIYDLCQYVINKKASGHDNFVQDIAEELFTGKANIRGLAYCFKDKILTTDAIKATGSELFFMPSIASQSMVENRNGNMRVQSSRGCIFNCGFCVVNCVFQIKKRIEFPVDCALDYIDKVVVRSTNEIVRIDIMDDEFIGYPVNYKRISSIFNGIIDIQNAKGKQIVFTVGANSNAFILSKNGSNKKLESLWQLAVKAGLKKVFLGLESDVIEQLRRFNKFGSPYSNRSALNFLRKVLKLRVEVAMILIDYEMDKNWRSELLRNFDFLYNTGLYKERALLIQVVKAIRYSPLFERYKKKGLLDCQDGRYSIVWKTKFENPETDKFVQLHDRWSSKRKAFYQLRYRLKQDLLFDIHTPEERIKKRYKDKLAEIEFFVFKELLQKWEQKNIVKTLESKLINQRLLVLQQMFRDIESDKIQNYSDYYCQLIESCRDSWEN